MCSDSLKCVRRKASRKWDTGEILLPDDFADHPWSWSDVFPAKAGRPIEVEIGAGKGAFLLARARQRPEINLLGVEYACAYACYTADRIRRAQLNNIKVLCTDARSLFCRTLPKESVFRVHVHFPDPWPKRKHHRRRLIQPEFLHHVYRVLQPGGEFLLVTDHQGYFEKICQAIRGVQGFLSIPSPITLCTSEMIVGTNFEKKYRNEGRKFYRVALFKVAAKLHVF